jgi:CRP-like cAMP-binding protein
MVSVQQLGSMAFFQGLDQAQLEAVAGLSQEAHYSSGTVLFEEGLPVQALHLLLEGCVELYYSSSADERDQRLVCEIDVGEPFAISALIEPHALTATAKVSQPSWVIKMDADKLRGLFAQDAHIGYHFMQKVAETAMRRLHYARIRLAVNSGY